MYEVKQSTALTLPFFVHDVSGDAVTGLTDGSFTKRISKNGAAFAAMTVTVTELENGWYSIPLSTLHSDTLGLLTIVFTNAGAKQVNLQFRVEAKLIDDLNDVAATDIVSAGAITTLSGAVVNVDTVDSLTANADKTGYSISATGLDAIVSTAIGMVEIAKAIWDRVLTGATHAVADSAGRRLRDLQEFGIYEGNAVWIDTVNGNVGTTDFESGTNINTVNSIGDANTLASSVGLARFNISPMSSITFAASQENQQFDGKNWNLALGGQSISNSHITGADVTGIATGAVEVHFDHCEMGICTLAAAHLDSCDISGTITLSAAAEYFFINCNHAGGTATINFGAVPLNTTVHVHGYMGALTIENMGQAGTDTLHFDSPGGNLTLAASCIGGTVNMNGTFNFINNGSGLTINDAGAIIEVIGVPVGVDLSADIADIPTVAEFNARTILSASYFDPATDIVANVTLVATTIINSDMRGTELAALATVCTEARLSELDQATGGKMANQVDIIQIDTTTDIPALIAALNDISSGDILTTALTESYAADGVAPTLAQALFAILQQAGEFAISGTVLTVKKLDGVVTAMTFTLDDATNPTSRTRAT